MAADLLLAIDNGTQSVRALVFDAQGNLLARSQVQIEPYFSTQPGWAEQHPQYFWDKLCEATRQLWAQGTVDTAAIAGLAVTTQRGTVITVDERGEPLRPAIIWLDQRRTEGQPRIGGWWGLLFWLSRMSDTAAYVQAEAEVNWIATHEPEVWAKTHKLLLLSGYLAYRLTGRFVDSVGAQVGYIPFDYKRLAWSSRHDWKWKALPNVRPDHLVDLVPPGQVLGEVTSDAAEATGIPVGLPVIAAAADKQSEVLGSGCLAPHIGGLSYGTTATMNTTHRRYIEAIPLIPPYPAAVPDAYSLEFNVYRGFWMVTWFKEQFGHPERVEALRNGTKPEALFDELVRQVPPGSEGLTLQPYWSPGIKIPGPEAKGAVIGFGDVHTRAHLYRAMLEGLAYAMREGKERSERRSGVPVTELRVSGGGSQSDPAMQITADVFGLPVYRPHVYETAGLGAAIDAAVGLGLHPSFDAAVAAMTRTSELFEPDPANQRRYDDLYRQVYKPLYGRLQPLYHAIRDITGYPPR